MSFRNDLEKIAEIYGGIAIFSVDPGSTTHRAGVRAGDVLIEVNGRRVRRLAEYTSARRLREDLLELVVVRNGKMLKLWAGIEIPAKLKHEPPANDQLGEAGLTCRWRGSV